jgi:addiction module RelE/StbE family toxin
MEKQVVWTAVSLKDFWEIVAYLKEFWPKEVLEKFSSSLDLKVQLLQKQPNIGFKSSKYSRFRKTLILKHYMLIYSVTKNHIVIHRIKHTAMK